MRDNWTLYMAAVVGLAVIVTTGCPASAKITAASSNSSKFIICTDQTYALCAVGSCFVLDGIAYCECDVNSGDSISLTDTFDNGENVCSINAEGFDNGYMVSTFSVPISVVAPSGNQALYTCAAGTSNSAYAQCDGGLCFTSTEGESFPGFGDPLDDNQIICSCPITTSDSSTAKIGYQIAGPYPCQKSFFKNCKNTTANTKTGSQIYVGAPTGSARLLARLLNGNVPALNQCLP
jgi:hypothetical protein